MPKGRLQSWIDVGETLLCHLPALESPLIHSFTFHFSLFFSLFIDAFTDHKDSKLNPLNQMLLMIHFASGTVFEAADTEMNKTQKVPVPTKVIF